MFYIVLIKHVIFIRQEQSYIAYKLLGPKKYFSSLFNVKEKDCLVIQVKNTHKYPHLGEQKVNKDFPNFSQKLVELLNDKKFIPVNPIDFLYYKGAEILFTSRRKQIFSEFDQYLEEVKLEPLKILI